MDRDIVHVYNYSTVLCTTIFSKRTNIGNHIQYPLPARSTSELAKIVHTVKKTGN